jgi:hypothetical protein
MAPSKNKMRQLSRTWNHKVRLIYHIPRFYLPLTTGSTIFWVDDSLSAESMRTAVELVAQTKRVAPTNIRAHICISGRQWSHLIWTPTMFIWFRRICQRNIFNKEHSPTSDLRLNVFPKTCCMLSSVNMGHNKFPKLELKPVSFSKL